VNKFLCSASVFLRYSVLYGIDAEPQVRFQICVSHCKFVTFTGCQKVQSCPSPTWT